MNHHEKVIWADQPAAHFAESYPIGNGRLGAMLFGNRIEDKIILGESGMWSGSSGHYDRDGRCLIYQELKRLLLDGKNREAQELYEREFTSNLTAQEEYAGASSAFGCYQVLGTLRISMHQNIGSGQYSWMPQWSEAKDIYRRQLDLEHAVHTVEYNADQTVYQRKALASYPDQIIALRYTADKPGQIYMSVRLDRPERFTVCTDGNNSLIMSGQLDNGIDGKGVSYACRVQAVGIGGRVYTEGCTLHIEGSDEALLIISAATDIKSFSKRQVTDVMTKTKEEAGKAAKKDWEQLFKDHIEDFTQVFNRTDFGLTGGASADIEKPLDKRLREFSKSDSNLIPLFYNYGKYLYISANRPGGFPSNLQGIWAEEIQTMFNGDWHLDAQEMNHWIAELWDMPDIHEAYLELIAFLQEPGALVAEKYYGARGWIVHPFTNPWGFCAPGAKAFYGAFMAGAGWLCQHLWDHYLFNEDLNYLKWAYPILKGAATFYLDVLFEEPEHHWLVTGPTISAENVYYTKEGDGLSLCMGSTQDAQILRYLFSSCAQAAKILNVDNVFVVQLESTVRRLPPTRISEDGRIMEWLKPYQWLPHRHISHLWGLYPGHEITPDQTPEMAKAAWKVIDAKTAATGGWAMAHRMNASARLKRGNEAQAYLLHMLSKSVFPNLFGKCHQIVENGQEQKLPGFDEYRVPFQIDANYACTAGIGEMLLQSHESQILDGGERLPLIHLLPALPDDWRGGYVRGLRARGGIAVSMEWADGRLLHAELSGNYEKKAMVRYGDNKKLIHFKHGSKYVLDNNLECIIK